MKNTSVFVLALLFAIIGSLVQLGSSQNSVPQSDVDSRGVTKSGGFPKCTDPLSDLPVPDAPHGLYVLLLPGKKALLEKKKQYVLNNPIVCGGDVYVQWTEVDRGPGASPRYDWSSVEKQMEPWLNAKKRVNFIVWAVGYGNQQRSTPEYVMSKVPKVSCPLFGTVPVFYDKEYMRAYQEFMAAFVKQYESNSSVGYIRFGLGAGGESFPACRYAMQKYGWTEDRWKNYILEMLDYEKSLNSRKQLMSSMIGQLPGISRDIAAHAAQLGIGIGIQGLAKDDVDAYSRGAPCKGDWCAAFDKFHGKAPLELQTLSKTEAGGSGTGSLVDLLQFGLQRHAQIFELYLQDWLVAYDPGDPLYGEFHADYQRGLESTAKVVGGAP